MFKTPKEKTQRLKNEASMYMIFIENFMLNVILSLLASVKFEAIFENVIIYHDNAQIFWKKHVFKSVMNSFKSEWKSNESEISVFVYLSHA